MSRRITPTLISAPRRIKPTLISAPKKRATLTHVAGPSLPIDCEKWRAKCGSADDPFSGQSAAAKSAKDKKRTDHMKAWEEKWQKRTDEERESDKGSFKINPGHSKGYGKYEIAKAPGTAEARKKVKVVKKKTNVVKKKTKVPSTTPAIVKVREKVKAANKEASELERKEKHKARMLARKAKRDAATAIRRAEKDKLKKIEQAKRKAERDMATEIRRTAKKKAKEANRKRKPNKDIDDLTVAEVMKRHKAKLRARERRKRQKK